MKIKSFLLIFWLALPTKALAQATAEELGQLWIHAIKNKNGETLRNAIHPLCPPGSVPKKMIQKMLGGQIPEKVQIEIVPVANPEIYKQTFAVMPERQLQINYVTTTDDEKRKFGSGKSQPISNYNGKWYFANCPKVQM